MDTSSIDIIKKAKRWVTWDDMLTDFRPYLPKVYAHTQKRVDYQDKSLIKEFCILELIMPKVEDILYKTLGDVKFSISTLEKAYAGVVADIVKLYNNSDDLEKLLETQTQLYDYEKNIIREDWENRHSTEKTYKKNKKLFGEEYFKLILLERDRIREDWRNQHSIETKGEEEYLKAKFTELHHYKDRIEKIPVHHANVGYFKVRIECISSWLRRLGIILQDNSADELNEQRKMVERMMAEDNSCSSTQASFPGQAPSDLHDENKEGVQSMRAGDNSCSSTQADIWRGSSEDTIVASSEDNIVEDNIVASSEDDILTLKKRKIDEC